MLAKKVRGLVLLIVVLCLAACGPALPVASTAAPPPANETVPPLPTLTPPTAMSTLSTGGSVAEWKYQVLAQYPNLFFCDPDIYPVARADEADLARQHFAELQASPDEFQAILKHNGLAGLTVFTDDQKLLIYREHKKLGAIVFTVFDSAYQFQLQVKESNQQGFLIKGLIDSRGVITAKERQSTIATCPICLAARTQIDTPLGPVAVEDLRAGDLVWTRDAQGARQATPILYTVRVQVPNTHQMAHVVLDDGRELWASPAHPTVKGQPVGSLQPGDWLDGARIAWLKFVPYDQPATYDLLPAGETGFYWANGILVGSTLAKRDGQQARQLVTSYLQDTWEVLARSSESQERTPHDEHPY